MRGQKMTGSEQALLSAAKGRQDDKAASPSQRSAPSRWQASHPHAAPGRGRGRGRAPARPSATPAAARASPRRTQSCQSPVREDPHDDFSPIHNVSNVIQSSV